MDGKRRTPVSPAVAAGEGRSILPSEESIRLFIAELGRVHIEMCSDWKRLVPCLAGSCSGSSTTRGSETGEAICYGFQPPLGRKADFLFQRGQYVDSIAPLFSARKADVRYAETEWPLPSCGK